LGAKRIYAACAGVHFCLITAVCFAGVFALVAADRTILPSSVDKYARKGEVVAASVLGKELAASNPVRRAIATYLHAVGSQAGYNFFAPNIPGYHRLILELYYHDGRGEYDSPHVSGGAAVLRLDSLLDRLADPRFEPLRGCWADHHPSLDQLAPLSHSGNPIIANAKLRYSPWLGQNFTVA
jgi:hypothetical protein